MPIFRLTITTRDTSLINGVRTVINGLPIQNRQQYELIENPNYVPGGLLPEVERHPITVGFMKNIGNQHEVRVSVPNMELSSIMRAISVATNIVK